MGAFFLLDDPLHLIFANDEPPTWAELNDRANVSVVSFPMRYMASRPAASLAGGGGIGLQKLIKHLKAHPIFARSAVDLPASR